ncbi:polymorphic toxin type 44 domain-containing protein [Saprospira grandis]|uniref:Rhs family-like protein n=1 Tax=Saprospira grandis (strain Lewin) TaxID=984262 RepID=H6L0H2_SAPGL|nr:polymorphic toxin type 44 domain-containing protein [Saprospira grandis]AFC23402.1 Rhs family-like protein [Saprospira grandis str. Lewin]
MVRDSSEQIEEIVWNVQGKLQEVHFEAGKPGPSVLQYEYDPMGNRLAKKKLYVDGPVDIRSEGQYYVRDPQGNVLAVYQYNEENIALVDDKDSLHLDELHLYGSARLGILKKALALRYRDESGTANWSIRTLAKTALAQSSYQQLELGRRRYELSNHLGNVLATVSDKSLGQDSSQTGQADYYLAQVSSASLYYPFGWEMPGRKFVSGEEYRFGFNGQEEDPDIAEGHTTALYWEYDSRIARRWNVDPRPVTSISPYNTFQGNPIIMSDALGDTSIYSSISGKLIERREMNMSILQSPVYVVNDQSKNYDSDNPFKTAEPLKYSIGNKKDKEAGRLAGITGNSFRKNHPLRAQRQEVTGRFAAPVGGQVYQEDLLDMSVEFNSLVLDYESLFRAEGDKYDVRHTQNLLAEMIFTVRGDWNFANLVTDNAPFDLKSTSRSNLDKIPSYAAIVIGEWSMLNGRLTRYDDYGNISYGYWGRAYGYTTKTLLRGSNDNQIKKDESGQTDGNGDEQRDIDAIKMGIKQYDNKR